MSLHKPDQRSAVDLAFCQTLPKVELHAHINGCIRDRTLLALLARKGATEEELSRMKVRLGDERTLSQCFDLFRCIHELVDDCEVVEMVTQEAIEDFAADNVRYLELRTTPRTDHGFTMPAYVQAVLTAIQHCEARLPITVRLILSINRAGTAAQAMETVQLAASLVAAHQPVVGVELSGNPTLGTWETFIPAFSLAKELGIRTSVHVAEVRNDEEVSAILAYKPDRLGHALHLHEQQHLPTLLHQEHCPAIEICPTSNLRTLRLKDYDEHPTIPLWLSTGYPFVICTDDFGVFATTLSLEYLHIAKAFRLSRAEVARLSMRAVDFRFGEDKASIDACSAVAAECEQILLGLQ